MNTGSMCSPDYQAKVDRQWAFEVAFFLQKIGIILRDTGEALNNLDYLEAQKQAAALEQAAGYEKTLQPDFKTSGYFLEARRLFNRFLDECFNFSELLIFALSQEESESEKGREKPVQIRESTERLNLLKEMLTEELHLYGWY